MAQTPKSITIDILMVPGVREILERTWNDGYATGVKETRTPDPDGWRRINPYETEEL